MSDPDWTKNHARPNVAAGVLFTDEQDRILMVEPTYKDYLDIPGGYVEKGETPYEAAQREVFEELSIKPPIGRLLVADWWLESPEEGVGSKVVLIFDGLTLSPPQISQIVVDGVELKGHRFLMASDLGAVTIPRLANRLAQAVEARAAGAMRYLESGSQAS